MSDGALKKIGGHFGKVRVPIDVERLNVHLARATPIIATPVTVKQFEVCFMFFTYGPFLRFSVRTGRARLRYYISRLLRNDQSNPTYILSDAKYVQQTIFYNLRLRS